MMPRMRPLILSIKAVLVVCFDLIRMAVLSITVAIALRPAARIVSPDSGRSW